MAPCRRFCCNGVSLSPQSTGWKVKKKSTPDFPVLVDICVLLLDVCWQLVHFFTPFSWSNMSGEFQWIADDLIILDLKVKMWLDDRCPFRWSIIRSTLLLYSYHGSIILEELNICPNLKKIYDPWRRKIVKIQGPKTDHKVSGISCSIVSQNCSIKIEENPMVF